MTPTKQTQSAPSRDEGCAGISRWDFMHQWEWILKPLPQCIWKAHSVITSCSPVTQCRGGDKHKGSSGGGSFSRRAMRGRAHHPSDLAFREQPVQSVLFEHTQTARNSWVTLHMRDHVIQLNWEFIHNLFCMFL